MNIKCGIESQYYKYVHGCNNKFNIPFTDKQISLTCGKNDRAAVQLLIYSSEEMIVCSSGDNCFYERGAIDTVRVEVTALGMDKNAIKVFLVGLVEDDDHQLKSDILLDKSSIYVEPNKVQPVWIEAEIGEDIKSGIYTPKIKVYGHRMFDDEVLLCTLSFKVKVLDLVLKKPQDYCFYLDLWQHNSNIARKYDLDLWSDGHFDVMEKYVKSLANLGQKVISIVVSEIPWSGQWSAYNRIDPSNLFEYNIVGVKLNKSGEWEYDFKALSRYVNLCMKYGIKQEIEVFGLLNIWLMEDAGYGKVIKDYDDAIRIRFFDESSKTYKYIRQKDDLISYVKALESNFQENGWIDIVRIVADEPADPGLFSKSLKTIRDAAPSFKYKAAINEVSFIENNIKGIFDYVPILNCVCSEYEKLKEIKKKIKGKVSYYVCCIPLLPNSFISSHLLETRLIPWLSWYLGLDGFLRWNYTVWPNDPLTKISYQYPSFHAGDTNFVYPGRNGEPMLTLRYKALERGIRDYEIINDFVAKTGENDVVRQLLKKVFLWQDIKELLPESRKSREDLFLLDYEVYEEIVTKLLETIVK